MVGGILTHTSAFVEGTLRGFPEELEVVRHLC
jgi:hypothetical protein